MAYMYIIVWPLSTLKSKSETRMMTTQNDSDNSLRSEDDRNAKFKSTSSKTKATRIPKNQNKKVRYNPAPIRSRRATEEAPQIVLDKGTEIKVIGSIGRVLTFKQFNTISPLASWEVKGAVWTVQLYP